MDIPLAHGERRPNLENKVNTMATDYALVLYTTKSSAAMILAM